MEGENTHHIVRDPGIKKAGSEEGEGCIVGARSGGGCGGGDSRSKTLVFSRRKARGVSRVATPNLEKKKYRVPDVRPGPVKEVFGCIINLVIQLRLNVKTKFLSLINLLLANIYGSTP
jgi:hypothetical protein